MSFVFARCPRGRSHVGAARSSGHCTFGAARHLDPALRKTHQTTTDNRLACGYAGLDGKPSTNKPTNEHGNRSSAHPHVISETMWRDIRSRAACMKAEVHDESDIHHGVSSVFNKQGNAHSKAKHLVAMTCSCGVALVNMCNFCFTHNGLSRRLLATLRGRKKV